MWFFNLGFAILSQLSRFILGSFYSTFYFEFLSNNWQGLAESASETDIFWSTFLPTTLLSILSCSLIIWAKIAWEKQKEAKLRRNIHVINVMPSTNQVNKTAYNTMSYNPSIMTELEMASYLLLLCVFTVLNVGFEFMDQDVSSPNSHVKNYKWRLYREIFSMNLLYKIILPSVHLAYKKEFQRYIKQIRNK